MPALPPRPWPAASNWACNRILFTANGQPLYRPYGLAAAILAILISHALGASVEALITALGMAYVQKQHPEYLTAGRRAVAGPDVVLGQAARRPLWQIVVPLGAGALVLLIIAGLITGGGDPAHFFGADWARVNWADVASMLLVTAVIAAVLIPPAWFVLPRAIKRVGVFFVALAVLAPLGRIAPGFAFGEGSADDVKAAFGYVPPGLQQFSSFFSAPLAGYNIPLMRAIPAPARRTGNRSRCRPPQANKADSCTTETQRTRRFLVISVFSVSRWCKMPGS